MSETAPDGTVYTVTGNPDGAAVVLVHGLGMNHAMWQWQQPALEKDYKVVAYDLVGHGATPPDDAPSLTRFAIQLRDLIDHLGLKSVAVIGFSLGGMIVRRFAMDFPDRLWAIGILHSAHQRLGQEPDDVKKRVDLVRREGPQATVEVALQRWLTDDYRAANPDVTKMIRQWILANDHKVYPGNYQVLLDGVDELVAPDPPIDCPALVVTGTDDPGQTPAMSERISAEISGSTLAVLPGLRHMGFVEQPGVYNTLILDFLADAETHRGNGG
ncbi:MAG: alpha/beta fold hydrolase [Alphaproteobacteria bacterium]